MLAAVSLAAAISLAGCGSGSSTPDSAPAPVEEPTRTPPPKAAPSATPTATAAPTAEATPSRSAKRHKVGELTPLPRAAAPDTHQLDADRIPTFDGHTWKLSSTDHAGAVGACQKTELETIGAVEAVSRRFTAEDGLAAVQVVARFPDAKTAWRAHQVLVAWREDCEERVRDSTVGPMEPVAVTAGTADSYLGSFRARSAGLGILRSGAILTLVEVAAGREAYPTKWDPARVAVRRIARTF